MGFGLRAPNNNMSLDITFSRGPLSEGFSPVLARVFKFVSSSLMYSSDTWTKQGYM